MRSKIISLFMLFLTVALLSSCVSAQKEQSVSEERTEQSVADETQEKSYTIIEKRLMKSDGVKKIYVYTVGTKVVAEETVDMSGNVVKFEGEIPSGTVRQYNSKNELISETYYDSSRKKETSKTYEDRTYFADGGIATIKTYTEDILDGPSIEFYEDGNKKIQANYSNGRLDGDYIKYGETGKIEYSSQFSDGHLSGEHKEYYEDGVLKKEEEYLNDKKEGICKEYFETGILKQQYNYAQDILEGEAEIYYEDGSIKRKEIYKNGKLHGDVRIYSNNNSQYPIYIDTYYNGKIAVRRAYSNKGVQIFKQTY